MEDHQLGQGQGQQDPNSPSQVSSVDTRVGEPVRSRWTPKPEQILILESIFNSGMVNPPKDETVRIRKLLEKFGSVGDANVFYWFQNRRSRSRRRQRQLQASLEHRNQQPAQAQLPHQAATAGGGVVPGGSLNGNINHHYDNGRSAVMMSSFGTCSSLGANSNYHVGGSSSSSSGLPGAHQAGLDGLFGPSPQMGFPEIDHNHSVSATTINQYPSDHASNLQLHYQSGLVSVFINGVATEVPRGPLDIKSMFGEEVVLVHSSGIPLPTDEFGFLMQSLQQGESYFLVSRTTQVG